MADFKNGIQLSVQLDTKNKVESDLNKLVSELNKNKIELNMNTNNLKKNLQDAFNLDGITKSAYSSAKVFENELSSIGNTIGKIREKSERKNRENNALQEAKEVNRALEEQYKLEQQMANIRTKADYNSKQRELQEQQELNKTLQKEERLINEIEEKRAKSQNKSILEIQKQELSQAKAINKALEDNYKSTLKEADAQKQVQQEIQKQIKLLEIRKQGMLSKNSKVDTSDIDNAISKYKQLDNISMKDLRNEISYINAELKASSSSAETFGSKLAGSLSKVGIYINAGDIFRGIANGAKDAIQYTMDVENSMIDLRRVVDMSDSSAKNFQENMHNLSLEMASTNADTISTVATFSKLGYSLQDATQLGEVTTKYNFAADINNMEDATLSLISTMKAYKIEASGAIGITNDINEVSNKYAVSANDINTILQKSASTMSTFGNSLQQNIALGTVANEIMQNSDTVGQALKSIGARITTNSNALDELEAMNISIEDANGNLKSTYQIFKEMSPLIQNMKGEELARVSNNLFGKQQISTGLSIVQNYQQLDEVMKTLEDTTGSVNQEFDRYLNSTQAKVSQLKENLGGLYSNFVNSDMTKGTVDGLNLLVTSITTVISKLGVIPTVITTVVGALTIFNSKFREGVSNLSNGVPILNKFVGNLNVLKTKLESTSNSQKLQITHLQNLKTQYQQAGLSTNTLNTNLAKVQGQLALTTTKMIATKVATIALQSALSMGLSLAITGVMTGVSNLINAQSNLRQSNEEYVSSLQGVGNNTTNSQELLNTYKSLKNELSTLETGTESYKSKEQELKQVQEQLLGIYPNVNSAINSNTGEKELNIKKTQELIDKEKEVAKAKANGVLGNNGISNSDDIKNQIRLYKEYTEEMKQANQWVSEGKTNMFGGTYENYASDLADKSEEYKNKLLALQGALSIVGDESGRYEGSLDDLNRALGITQNETDKNVTSTGTLQSEIEKLQGSIDDTTDSEESNSNAISQNTELYSKCTQSIAQAQGYIERLNKAQAVTPTLAKQIATAYPEIGSAINDVSSTVDFLNQKIQEQADIQSQAYEIMIGDDEQFYQDKIANNSEFQNAYNSFLNSWLNDGESTYNVDLGNYKTLNELKSASQNDLGVSIENWLSQFVGSSASGYADDFANFKSFAEAKASVINKLNEALRTMQANINSNVDTINNATSDMSSGEAEKLYGKNIPKLEKIENAIKDVDTNFDGISGQMKGFSGGSIGTSGGGVGGGSKGGSGGKGSSGKSDAEKAEEERIKNMEKLLELNEKLNNSYDRYFDYNNAYDEINNKIKEQETLIEGLTGSDKIKAEADLLNLKKQQIQALKNLNEERKREANEIAVQLQAKGFEIDANGKLINSQKRLAELQEELKQKTYDISENGIEAKEKDIEELKNLEETTKDYIKLVNDEIPSCTDQYNQLANAIKKAQEEQLQALREDVVKGLQDRYEKAREEAESADEEWYNQRKENLESQYQSDMESIQKEKQSIVDEYDEQIKKLQAQLDELNDDSDDKQAKLASLKAELALWSKDDSVNQFERNAPYVQKCA